ncbi:MAG: outer membrane lipoprotein-sorting protein [Burkholderiales bacterium]|nr:outer membrane lipoprotein-sorting protein [Burkholderiales bacterium]
MPARPAASPRIGPPIDASRRQTLRRGLLVTLGDRGLVGLGAVGVLGAPSARAQSASSTAPPEDDPQARLMVQRADEIRFPRDAFQVDVRVTSTSGGQTQDPRRYRILSKGNDNTIILTLEPTAEKGQNLLMKGRELWVFMPSVSQPVRLSLSQRLTGQVANGDLARANFSGDYLATLKGQETIGGREHHVLELAAGERSVTYPRILYWVRAGDFHPQRAEFHSLSGKLLKTCRYEQFATLGGRVRPTRLVMTDELKRGDESILDYSDLKSVELPDRLFSKEYLKKLD